MSYISGGVRFTKGGNLFHDVAMSSEDKVAIIRCGHGQRFADSVLARAQTPGTFDDLAPLTRNGLSLMVGIPRCLVRVGERSLVANKLDILRTAGFNKFALCIGSHDPAARQYVQALNNDGYSDVQIVDHKHCGSRHELHQVRYAAGLFKKASSYLVSTAHHFLDASSSAPYSELVAQHAQQKASLTVLACPPTSHGARFLNEAIVTLDFLNAAVVNFGQPAALRPGRPSFLAAVADARSKGSAFEVSFGCRDLDVTSVSELAVLHRERATFLSVDRYPDLSGLAAEGSQRDRGAGGDRPTHGLQR